MKNQDELILNRANLLSASRSWLAVAVVVPIALLGFGLLAGCSEKPAKQDAKQKAAEKDEHAAHEHPEEGPHGGHLIELGNEEYHAELIHDDATHKVTIYILDGKASKAVPIEESELALNLVVDGKPQQYQLVAAPLEGEGARQSSRFELADEALADGLDHEGAKGRINVTIAGKPYVGDIEGHDHEDDHDHEKH